MARLSKAKLIQIARQEVEKYEGISPHAAIYAILDDERHRYAVNAIENQPGKDHSWIILQVHIDDGFIVIDEDGIWEKKFDAMLENAGVPREQIVLAYLGEPIPSLDETK